jgi:hypothetical protein
VRRRLADARRCGIGEEAVESTVREANTFAIPKTSSSAPTSVESSSPPANREKIYLYRFATHQAYS